SALPNFNYSQFIKIYTGNRIYFNLNKIIPFSIFATSLKVGDIIEYGTGTQLVPVQPIYKFFSGGSGSLRGWNAKENGILVNKELGGNFLLEGSIELRKKLFPKKENFMKNINGALFVDYGNVWETSKQFRIDQIALATGFGFRYDLFFGAVRIDFGFKLYDPNDADAKWLFSDPSKIFKSKFAIQFGIGEAF
ncbi:MAG: BamA/TamA family outer membrane protein, partial [bacterium]